MNELKIEDLRKLYKEHAVMWTSHVSMRLHERKIYREDVENCIMHGEIIEQYPDDYPYPSCLVLGFDTGKQHLHVVIGTNGENLWIISAYRPDLERWEPDFKTRKEKKQ